MKLSNTYFRALSRIELEYVMNWTKKLPDKSGHYWWRKNRYKSNSMYYVFDEDGVWYCRWCSAGLYDKRTLSEVGGEWFGPLRSPDLVEDGTYLCMPCVEDS